MCFATIKHQRRNKWPKSIVNYKCSARSRQDKAGDLLMYWIWTETCCCGGELCMVGRTSWRHLLCYKTFMDENHLFQQYVRELLLLRHNFCSLNLWGECHIIFPEPLRNVSGCNLWLHRQFWETIIRSRSMTSRVPTCRFHEEWQNSPSTQLQIRQKKRKKKVQVLESNPQTTCCAPAVLTTVSAFSLRMKCLHHLKNIRTLLLALYHS